MEIKIKVKTKASVSKLEEIAGEENSFVAFVTSAPENNKANLEIIKLISKKFRVAKSLISLKSGQKSKEKIFEILE